MGKTLQRYIFERVKKKMEKKKKGEGKSCNSVTFCPSLRHPPSFVTMLFVVSEI